MTRHVVGVFRDEEAAHAAVESLLGSGTPEDQVSILRWEDPGHHGEELIEFDQEERAEAINAGLWSGGALGGIAGLLAGAVSVIAAPIGAIAVFGSLTSALGGATIGATMGGFAGSLAKIGWSKRDVEELIERLENGSIIVAITVPTSQATAVTEQMEALDPDEVKVI